MEQENDVKVSFDANIFEKGSLIYFFSKVYGYRSGVAEEFLNAKEIDTKFIKANSKTLLQEDVDKYLKPLSKIKSAALREIKKVGYFVKGFGYVILTKYIQSLTEILKDYQRQFETLAKMTIEAFPTLIENFEREKPEIFKSIKYPEDIQECFLFNYQFVKVSVPNDLPEEIKQEEIQKLNNTAKRVVSDLSESIFTNLADKIKIISESYDQGNLSGGRQIKALSEYLERAKNLDFTGDFTTVLSKVDTVIKTFETIDQNDTAQVYNRIIEPLEQISEEFSEEALYERGLE